MTSGCDKDMLVIRNLKYDVNGFTILHNISVNVGKGEFIGLIGPNGAGKTTLLKCINGINKGQGSIELKGQRLEDMDSRKIARNVALMHQNTSITFPFTAFDIVMTGRYPYLSRTHHEGRQDYSTARKYMEYTDTLRFESKSITALSGGERQRVLFAKILTQETELILLDEPTASLDITHEEQIFKYCSELCEKGRTVIAAVHDLKTAAHYCTRLVLMKEGRIIADGLPQDVLTSENLSKTYGVNALVYRNRITGLLDFYIHGITNDTLEEESVGYVHVIGGGGSASGVVRLLFEKGYKITAGVFAHGDSDLNCAEIFGIDCLVCRPFSEISDESYDANIERIRNADMTILCDMPFGIQNFKNLLAAKLAHKLVIVEDSDPASRDFTGGKALEAYEELKANAVVVTSVQLHEVL